MGYKMDIPTLSANEVYTLTFEYEGEETVQLTVGDQTLETTDRRVVFTTTSPVNYIESNVKLENLDLYEGYYESDDQDGEYTQESYIEGKTEITDNVMKCVKSPKIVSRNEDGTEESVISTPSDLELYAWKDSKGTWVKDKLDLITGTYHQYYDMWDLGTLLSQTDSQTGFNYNADTGMVSVQWNLKNTHPSGTVWGGQGGFSALIGDYFEYGYGNSKYETSGVDYTSFFTSATKIKKTFSDGSVYTWWLRTAVSTLTTAFYNVKTSGSGTSSSSTNYPSGVALGFCT